MAWRWKRTMPTAITLIITYCILVAFTPVTGSTTGVQDAYIARVCLQGMELEGGIWWDDWNPGCLVYEKGWYYNTQIYSCRYYSESLKHPLINQSVYIMKCQWWVMLRVFASLTPHLDEPCRQLPGQKVFCGFPPWRPHVIWADSRLTWQLCDL